MVWFGRRLLHSICAAAHAAPDGGLLDYWADGPAVDLFGGRLGAVDHRLGRRVDAFEQLLDVLAGQRLHLDALLLGLFQEGRILQGLHERAAQRTHPLVRNAGRREERTAHLLRGEQKLQHLPVLAAPGVVENGRDVRNLRMFFQRHLEQDVDPLLLQPVGLAQLEEGPADAAKSLGLPALHGQKDLGATGITGDDSELRPQELVEARGNITSWAAELAPPTISSVANTSVTVFTAAVCQATHTLFSMLALPIQLNRSGSNRAFWLPSSGSSAAVRAVMANSDPSRAALL